MLALHPEIDEHADLGADHIGIEGLVEEVDRAARISLRDRVPRRLVGRENDDRHAVAAVDLLQERRGREAIELGHLQVQQDEREVLVLRLRDRLPARAREHEALPERLEDRFERDEVRWMIIDEQDARLRPRPATRHHGRTALAARWT